MKADNTKNLCQLARNGRLNALEHLSTMGNNRRERTPSLRTSFLCRVSRMAC